jgi:hypothetical protein
VGVSPRAVARRRQDRARCQVEIGLAELPHAEAPADDATNTDSAVVKGTKALLHASDLIGDACGFRVVGVSSILRSTTT